MPFRDNVLKYPSHSPLDTPNGQGFPNISIRPQQNGSTTPPQPKTKGLSAAEAIKRRQQINSGQVPAGQPGQPGQRPEDKPDSPEYKKKQAMLTGPILELTYENASQYGMEESTFTALKDIFNALITSPSRTGVLSPQRFLEIFKRDNEMFRTSMHQDAHEFYGLVLNAIISNVEANAARIRELEPPKENGDHDASLSAAANAMGLPSGSRSPGTGWVHEIFEGVLTSETKCLTCETASQRDETFLDLSIDLEQHSSVTSCLRKFSAEEMLCERNKFHCDNCGGLQEAEKRMKIKRLPKILALHLKRFKYTEDMTRLQKLFHRVVYPYYLRMFNTTDDAEDPDRLYELYAVVVHIGGNAYHGHYVSVIKTKDRGWLLFDDEMVEPVDKHYVRNFFGDKPGMACAYVLFYQETTYEAMRKEQEAEGAAEVALAEKEAGLALSHTQTNGISPMSALSHQATTPITPIDEHGGFSSLDHAMSAPLPITASSPRPPVPPMPATPPSLPSTVPKITVKTKEEKEREKKAEKEAEKMRKAAEKDRIKAEEKRRKEMEQNRRNAIKNQEEDMKRVLELSKKSAAEEEAKRKKEAATTPSAASVSASVSTSASISNSIPTPPVPANETSNGTGNGNGSHSSISFNMGGLSRNHKGSKSMSRKSFGFLNNKNTDGSDTAVDGLPGPQTPEKHEKAKKERFSFSGLGRKKSNLMSG
ncbi:putative ubiquitin carboxyl-terminal hydrolase creB [Xylogone sp. PMI_703]|nr:putative ubiquitin carboxyl-terminal hydrolase creB [Xylogone sp. PMI_703]